MTPSGRHIADDIFMPRSRRRISRRYVELRRRTRCCHFAIGARHFHTRRKRPAIQPATPPTASSIIISSGPRRLTTLPRADEIHVKYARNTASCQLMPAKRPRHLQHAFAGPILSRSLLPLAQRVLSHQLIAHQRPRKEATDFSY